MSSIATSSRKSQSSLNSKAVFATFGKGVEGQLSGERVGACLEYVSEHQRVLSVQS